MSTLNTRDVADRLRITPTTVQRLARRHGLGINLGGRAGLRFTEGDVEALWEKLRPTPEVTTRRRRRAS